MKANGEAGDVRKGRSMIAGILARRCARCREGRVFRSTWAMNEECPHCGLDFDRGEPGYFTGAMYVSYALVIPIIALLTLIEHLVLPNWSLFRLVVLATLFCLPSTALIWQYSRVMWIYFDRYFDPEDEQDEHRRSVPHS
jgi:uncharacterized protein (DUF983 family)